MKDAILSVVGFLPNWYIAACLITGLVIFPIIAVLASRPLLRGLSYGLWETVVFYKCGVSFWRVFKRFVRTVFIDLPSWGFLNSTSSITNNAGGWYGIFSWRLKKSFTRANSIRENKETAKNPAPIEPEEADEEPFVVDLDSEK